MIRVIVDKEERKVDKKKIRVELLLERFHINPETALVLRGGELLTEDEELRGGDTCVILRTVAAR